jgi:hypothetical protein
MVSAALSVLMVGALPVALDGESISEVHGNGTAIAVVSLVSMIACYALLFALWRYVFSAKAKAKRREPPD